LKLKALCLMSQVPAFNQQRNSVILEKLMELKPTSITQMNYSYCPWPKSQELWSQTMLKWGKAKLPKLKSASYADIDLPKDIMTNCVARKEFPYYIENGNKPKSQNKQYIPKTTNDSGDSGTSVWDFINGKNY
jgi:hypothetical protein